MATQALLDMTDVAIVAAFVSAVLAFIVYMWRSGHPPRHHDRLS
jgi:Na+/H+ antiporter NhaC